jgi:hypothetical protein
LSCLVSLECTLGGLFLAHAAAPSTINQANLPTLLPDLTPILTLPHQLQATEPNMTTLPGIDGNLPLPAGSPTTPQYFLGIEGSANKVRRMASDGGDLT